ncbi:hypothetical protein IEQ34_008657 [Dendrobium chrysotoxum]|uniref:Uncharacterized protein n=1 Tax=Dendrobium chrysotoxum TaxID=161865 RepID=A0AAV7GX82_DENCH|nr:hypothetical protein IEQ34_008657 [Dendrobium chrysotoxum]
MNPCTHYYTRIHNQPPDETLRRHPFSTPTLRRSLRRRSASGKPSVILHRLLRRGSACSSPDACLRLLRSAPVGGWEDHRLWHRRIVDREWRRVPLPRRSPPPQGKGRGRDGREGRKRRWGIGGGVRGGRIRRSCGTDPRRF